MDLTAEKLSIPQTIINTNDKVLIKDVYAFLADRKIDWFDELGAEQQQDVLEGIAEADRVQTVSHEDIVIVKVFGKWGLK